VDTPESSASPPPTASDDSRRWNHPYRTILLTALVLVEATAWAWAGIRSSRATALNFGDARCYVADLLPRAYVLSVTKYDPSINPVLGAPGRGWMSLVHSVSQPFITDHDTFLGFGVGKWRDDGYGGNAHYVRVPHLAVVMLLMLPLLREIWLSFRRHPRGCCRHCGYDLRATPDRCPECGAVPAPKA
jgi:hypothetical protein